MKRKGIKRKLVVGDKFTTYIYMGTFCTFNSRSVGGETDSLSLIFIYLLQRLRFGNFCLFIATLLINYLISS